MYCLGTNGSVNVSIIWNSRVSTIQGFLIIEVYGETVRNFRIVCYIVVGVHC